MDRRPLAGRIRFGEEVAKERAAHASPAVLGEERDVHDRDLGVAAMEIQRPAGLPSIRMIS